MSGKGGSRRWAIPEGYIPSGSVDPDDPTLLSHEAACLLNASDVDADIVITIFFEDREPAGPYKVRLSARRTKHLRFNDLNDPETIPRDTAYASLIEILRADCCTAHAARFTKPKYRAPKHNRFQS